MGPPLESIEFSDEGEESECSGIDVGSEGGEFGFQSFELMIGGMHD